MYAIKLGTFPPLASLLKRTLGVYALGLILLIRALVCAYFCVLLFVNLKGLKSPKGRQRLA